MNTLFDTIDAGAEFSKCRKYRYSLWRIWDKSMPLVMFIGLNPSTANEKTDDPTIRRVIAIAKQNGFGGVYMMNCYPLISTDPKALKDIEDTGFHDVEDVLNEEWLHKVEQLVDDVIFAWGNFRIVSEWGRDKMMLRKFPNAKALHINKNGSPKHPLYCRTDSKLITYKH